MTLHLGGTTKKIHTALLAGVNEATGEKKNTCRDGTNTLRGT